MTVCIVFNASTYLERVLQAKPSSGGNINMPVVINNQQGVLQMRNYAHIGREADNVQEVIVEFVKASYIVVLSFVLGSTNIKSLDWKYADLNFQAY